MRLKGPNINLQDDPDMEQCPMCGKYYDFLIEELCDKCSREYDDFLAEIEAPLTRHNGEDH